MTQTAERETDVGGAAREAKGKDAPVTTVVTIDGPAASGKSSVARLVAGLLGIPYVSSGLLYRAATHLVLREGVDAGDEAAVLALLEAHDVLLDARLNAPNRILLDGQDVSHELHTDQVDAFVSSVARHPNVRVWVYRRLREIRGAFVIEGRDMGRVVFQGARHKFYLTATPEVRAARRVGERLGGLAEVTDALKKRDLLDTKQLEPAPDAIHLDTSGLTIDEVVARVLEGVREKA